jgi:NAD(P)-dependent dehydrogenase (short-subunit alcohol dehydrogenase family)
MAGLDGKVAIVTGGARGIGAGIARCLARDGAKVAILDLDGEAAAGTAQDLGNGSMGMVCDVADEAQIRDAFAQVVATLGGLDIVANNAGAGRGPIDLSAVPARPGGGRVEDMAPESWDEQLSQNLKTTYLGTKWALPHLKARGGGSIVNIASIAGITASPTLPAYAAAKAGVISLTRSTALEHAPANIRANAILPGFLWTRAWEGMATGMKMMVPQFADREPRDIFLEIVKNGVPLQREQTPEDIGNLAAFLCSEGAHNITGQAISVDGGITLR